MMQNSNNAPEISQNNCKISVEMESQEGVLIQIASENQLNLHSIVRALENCGIIASSETLKTVGIDGKQFNIYHISGSFNIQTAISLKNNPEFVDVLEKSLTGQISYTTLNKLSVTSQTKFRDILLLRTYIQYLKQIQFQFSEEIINDVFAKNPQMISKILEYFHIKFEPSFTQERKPKLDALHKEMSEIYAQIMDITEDTILRQLYRTIQATVRTNFFFGKEYISLKFDCSAVPNLPKPVPFREIFVYSSKFEALHLRFGKVARGGLRWSDRPNDFRTEVLGLVKAQNTKNAVIVPVGSKGGFVITKDVSTLSKEDYLAFGQECYKNFIRGCLDLADNIITGEVKTNDGIVRYDDEDPYFVVAADKGTATFSDIANSISAEYNFWLGDAFASGGSNGYDHKKMGITAKGAWIAVRRHMMEMGRNPETEEFTCVGIGDMSGDVFGNGLIISRKTKLVAAFNHLHIFVDPTPDAEKSFIERERMFNLPRSTWADYNKSLISKGGMVYERSAKVCKLTPEIKELLEITTDEVSPNELIIAILKAKVDLLWNGGIGTYVKSSDEKNSDAGDKANNAIRINGKDLRALVVGEGGNLGFTQKGRIEYAKNGGRINTDAMDNSAGVNCSDVEVNIKITLNKLVSEGKLSLEQRNELLNEMTPEVERLVLRNNYLQTQAITITSFNQKIKIDDQESLMKKLAVFANLDRENEFLPSTDEMNSRKNRKDYLTRPELCVLFAYSKIYLYQELLKSSLINEKYFEQDLINYFPKQMQERFRDDIVNHKLAKEIIATSVNNSIINRVGITFMNNILESRQCKPCDVIRAYIVIREIFSLRKIWTQIESLDFKIPFNIQVELCATINGFIHKCIHMLLSHHFAPLPITQMVENMLPCINILNDFVTNKSEKTGINSRKKILQERGIPSEIAFDIAKTIEEMQMFQMVVHNHKPELLEKQISGYYALRNEVAIDQLSNWIANIPVESVLHKNAIRELELKLYAKYCTLSQRFSHNYDNNKEKWMEEKQKQLALFAKLVDDIAKSQKQDFALVSMIVDKIDIL